MKYEKIKTPQGELLYVGEEKHLYSKHGTSKKKSIWTCYQKTICKRKNSKAEPKCFARFTVLSKGKGVREYGRHTNHGNHETIYADLIRRKLINDDIDQMVRISSESVHTINTKNIFNRRKVEGDIESSLNYERMAPQFYRRKHKNRPKLPKECHEIKTSFENEDIFKKYGYTLDGKSKFYIDTILSENHSFCVFQSQTVTDMIKTKIDDNQRRYLIDGTFKTAATPFTQCVTVSVEYKQDIYPLFYILSTSKRTACYKAIFEFIEQQFQLKPKEFMSDFETGLRKALKEIYPQASINGCWFHYRKCILKKVKRSGISKLWIKEAKDNDPETALQAKRIYKMVCMLPLLPKQQFLAGYKYVRSMASKFKLMNKFGQFFKYYDRTWIAENKRNPLSVAGLSMRTTSSVESMHAIFGRSFPNRPNIYSFIENIRHFEFSKADTIRQLVKGDVMPKKKRDKDQKRDEKIDRLSELLSRHKISIENFLYEMANDEFDEMDESGQSEDTSVESEE